MRLTLRFLSAVAFCAVAVLVLAARAPSASAASDWPTHSVKFILTLGPGAGSDIEARLFADRLSRRWGQPVVVENRPGGDGIVAINAFVGAHDDHVLLFAPTSSFTAHPFLHDHLPYKPSDLAPITRVSNTLITISVPTSLGVNSLDQLVARARKEPGKLNWAGVTGALDFIFAGWLKQENLDISKVAYKNPVDAANDLAEGRVQVYESALAIVRPQLQSGKIKLLAVTNSERAPTEPDLPTVQQAGYPALTIDGLVGLFGPPSMPLALRKRITEDFRAVADDTIKQRLSATGQILNIGGPEEFAKSADEQRAKVAAFAKELGIAPLPQN
ncbi:MAG TPA: tripartite tricarboxylate transporter substrate binding protein [Xanthobacteraceae bacterium]|nr:tripartite tricarboxylate transporter substrate binding protein [Xanthobacteraceae bacterium]